MAHGLQRERNEPCSGAHRILFRQPDIRRLPLKDRVLVVLLPQALIHCEFPIKVVLLYATGNRECGRASFLAALEALP